MAGLPEITIAGTVVADPEIRFLDSGACVANFTVAANDRRFDRDKGEWVDAGATFLRCSIWRQAAENAAASLTKGMRVLVTGTLKQRSFETETGEKRTAFEVDVTEVAASLRFATATVTKNPRQSSPGRPEPAAAGSGFSDEPPF